MVAQHLPLRRRDGALACLAWSPGSGDHRDCRGLGAASVTPRRRRDRSLATGRGGRGDRGTGAGEATAGRVLAGSRAPRRGAVAPRSFRKLLARLPSPEPTASIGGATVPCRSRRRRLVSLPTGCGSWLPPLRPSGRASGDSGGDCVVAGQAVHYPQRECSSDGDEGGPASRVSGSRPSNRTCRAVPGSW